MSRLERLDPDDVLCRMPKSEGALVNVNSDARGTKDFADMDFTPWRFRRLRGSLAKSV
ncbi:hypothetical protein [Rhodoblastus sp.]|uniref:hypothetical protein n=1 Tax=Rhodoblastus sp. TaxID=1962975 RepID=UPI00263442FC|nr:hypothetical protein [Rhodoblastus sp.]